MKPQTATDAERRKLEKMKRLRDLQRNYMLFAYEPYPKQKDFHAAGNQYRERCFMAGNRLGKCILQDTLIDTPNGGIAVQKLKAGDTVFAWDGGKVEAAILQPFMKEGLHKCALLVMSDGRTIGVADHHRIYADDWQLISELLPKSFFCRPQSIVGCALSIHGADARHWFGIVRGWMERYSVDFHPCDEPLHAIPGHVQASSPLQAGAQACNRPSSNSTDIPCEETFRLASLGALRLRVAQCVGSLVSAVYRLAAPSPLKHLGFRLLSPVVTAVLRSVGGVGILGYDGAVWKNAWRTPDVDGNRIIAVIPIGSHKVYDFTVPKYHNYTACGLIHHNTHSAAAETGFHATGLYPPWWTGLRFHRATRGWVSSKNAEVVRDGAQRLLLGPINALGTGMIPKDRIVEMKRARGIPDAMESVIIRHTSGDQSLIVFKGYQDGREA